MNRKLWTKMLASLLVMTLTFANFILLGVYASKSYATEDNLEKQITVTNNENVTFDAYFKDEKGKAIHTLRENIAKQDLKLYVAVGVKKGYLKNAKTQILGENNTNSNLKLNSSNETLEYIESIDQATGSINLKQVNGGTQIVLEIPVAASKDDVYEVSNFSKLNDITLTGNYIGDAGKETKITKAIQTRNEWIGEATPVLEQELIRFIPYQVASKTGTILQTMVRSGFANNALPVKENKITIQVPSINGKNPQNVNVAPNGNLTKDTWTYDSQSGILTITVKNEVNDNKVLWSKTKNDEFIVTYIFDEKVDTLQAVQNATSEIEAYNGVETKLSATNELAISQNETLGQIVTGTINTTEALSKGYLYSKAQKEIAYNEIVTVDIAYPELVDSLTIKQDMDYFVNEKGEIAPTTIGNTNYAYYKTTKVSKANFEKILGTEGSLKITTLQGQELCVFNKDTEADENGDYVFNYQGEINQIAIITSAPVQTGKLEIRHEKQLKGNTDYSKAQVESFKTLKAAANIQAFAGENIISNVETLKEMTLVAPTTKIEAATSNESLSTVVTNENVELRVILKTNDITCDLYKNPTVEIILPNYISILNIKDINLLFDDELKIKDYNTYLNENGNVVIKVNIEGEQTKYSQDEISKGANLIINTDITLKQLTPTTDEVMKAYVTNELVTAYEQTETTKARSATQKGYTIVPLKAVAPVGMVTTNSISGHNAKNETVTSMSSQEQVGKLDVKKEARTATINMNVINNYQNVVNNVSILGRVPTAGTKDVETGEDFKSNLVTTMASAISVSGMNAEVYYSTNANATKDLNLNENAWTKTPENLANVKSYLIVLNGDMATGTVLGLSYKLAIPENVNYNMQAYSNYAVYFNNVKQEGTVSEKVVATKVGLESGEGPELEVSINSDVEGKEVQEGQIITYKVTVKNTGKSEAKNVSVLANIPEKTIYTYIIGTGGEDVPERTYDNQLKTYSETIESIKPGETKTITYQVEAQDLLVGYDKDGNIDTVEKFTIKNNAKVTVQGYDIEFTTNELENELIQGYLKVRMEVATIPEEYVRAEGDEVTYVIYVENPNAVEKKNLNVKTTLPEGVTYIGSTGLGKYDESTRQLTWNIESLTGNKTIRYQFGVNVDKLQENVYDKVIKTKAIVTGEKEVESNETSITVQKANLKVTQSSDTKTASVGDTIIYNFEVKNEGKGDAPNVEFIDSLPEGLQYESVQYSYNGKTYNSQLEAANSARITIGGLKPGNSLMVSIKAIVKDLPEGVNQKQVTNKATVKAEGIPEIVSNEITHTIVPKKNSGDPSTDPDNPQEGTYHISGIVWLDANQDGKRDDNEQRMPGVPVILINAENGQIVKDITTGNDKKQETNANGEYTFSNLKPGNYMVVFLYDSGNYGVTIYKQAGINDDKNSDAVQMNVVYEGKNQVGAASDKLNMNNENITNIDLGLVTSPKFDLKLDKVISQITVSDMDGTDVYNYKDTKLAKLDLNSKKAIGSTVMIEYKIRVTNEGGVAGYAKKIVDYMPSDMKFNSSLNKDWYTGDNGTNLYNASLANTLIQPGETKEITLLLTKKITDSNMGIINNTAEIAESYNDLGLKDIDSTPANKVQNEDDYSGADVIIGTKTGEVYMYILLTITTISIFGVGIYLINKKVLKRI